MRSVYRYRVRAGATSIAPTLKVEWRPGLAVSDGLSLDERIAASSRANLQTVSGAVREGDPPLK